jgi:hypothetical protein
MYGLNSYYFDTTQLQRANVNIQMLHGTLQSHQNHVLLFSLFY